MEHKCTTAGYKNTFPYQKLITLLIRMVLEPGKAMIMGGTWRIPVLVGLQSHNFVDELKRDGTYNDAAFEREYESKWSGTVEDAFFNGELFDRARRLQQPEWEYSGRSSDRAYYILSVDVGRRECDTVICAIKVNPQSQGPAIKSLVNIYVIHDEHFQDQAITIKKLYYKYKARAIIIDGNGLGAGLVDFMVKSQIDDSTGDFLPDFGVINDPDGEYRRFRTPDTELDSLYIIKANAPINTEAHSNVQTQLRAGKIRFLIDDRVARTKLLGLQKGKKMTPEERAEYLKPFTLTSILKEEINIFIVSLQSNLQLKTSLIAGNSLELQVTNLSQIRARGNAQGRVKRLEDWTIRS